MPSLFVVVLFAFFQLFGRQLVDRTLVTVNDEVILESDVKAFQQKLQSRSFQELFGGIKSDVLTDHKKALQLLIEERIIDQQVKKLDLKASDIEIDAQIRTILKRNGISTKQLEERLKQLGSSLSQYRDGIKRQIERKNLLDREVRPSLEVSQEQVRHYYLRTKTSSQQEREYKIAHILIESSSTKSPEKQAQQLYTKLKSSPELFDEFVKSHSADLTTKASGGFLGTFLTSSLAKEFREVIPKINEGQVSQPIRTGAGFHLVKVLSSKTSDFSSLPKERHEALRNQLLEEEMEKKMQLWLERKKAESFIRFAEEQSESKS